MSKENLLLIQKVVNILAAVVLLLAGLGGVLQELYATMIPHYHIDPLGPHRSLTIISFVLGGVLLTQVFVSHQLRNIESNTDLR